MPVRGEDRDAAGAAVGVGLALDDEVLEPTQEPPDLVRDDAEGVVVLGAAVRRSRSSRCWCVGTQRMLEEAC